MASREQKVLRPFHVCTPRMVLGEAPIYRPSDGTLHWVDPLVDPAELHILHVPSPDPSPNTDDPLPRSGGPARVLKLEESVTVVAFREGREGYICAYYAGIAFMDEATGRLDILKEIVKSEERGQRRMNDGAVDARGRFWVAEIDIPATSLPKEEIAKGGKGRVWRYDPDGTLHEMDTGFICGNGLCWSPDHKHMYINDSVGQRTYKYDFDLDTGNITNKTVFIDRREEGGEPDGMVVDVDGNLWVAVYDSSRVMVYSPEGKHLREVTLSARNPTCPTWGGPNWDILYITTASDRGKVAGPDDEGGHVCRYHEEGVRGGRAKYEFAG
ncbi:gluconolactonase [Diplogelasinospora grovesii]|uniref:Gluconolactonase n=1 Tax=Diplogelasinospora grovesii TaxID=303347 RepID=A0AAN6S5D4_9PEZI|nr:gluconolactonase [Diplogelasinospora grovesii]